MSTKVKSAAKVNVKFMFMKRPIEFSPATLERKLKAAISNKAPRDASHFKHQIHLPRTFKLVNHPVTYVWFAEEVLGVPAMCLTNDGQSMRGAYNPGQVCGVVNRHMAPLGLSATSIAPPVMGEVIGKVKENGKRAKPQNMKGANLAHAKQAAVNAHKRLIDNMNEAELKAAKQRAKHKTSKQVSK